MLSNVDVSTHPCTVWWHVIGKNAKITYRFMSKLLWLCIWAPWFWIISLAVWVANGSSQSTWNAWGESSIKVCALSTGYGLSHPDLPGIGDDTVEGWPPENIGFGVWGILMGEDLQPIWQRWLMPSVVMRLARLVYWAILASFPFSLPESWILNNNAS